MTGEKPGKKSWGKPGMMSTGSGEKGHLSQGSEHCWAVGHITYTRSGDAAVTRGDQVYSPTELTL